MGTLYCIGVGPGDPELLTLKAIRYIKKCPVLAIPQGHTGVTTAKQILMDAVEDMDDVDLSQKEIISIDFPMTRDEAVLADAHQKGAAAIEGALQEGKDVALITLGCPTIYASSIYVHRRVQRDGYATEIVPGVPSFCAAAAKLQMPLCEKDEPLTIIPGNRKDRRKLLALPGHKIVMKSSGSLETLKDDLAQTGQLETTAMIERCGMPGETVYTSVKNAERAPYFSVLLVRKEKDE